MFHFAFIDQSPIFVALKLPFLESIDSGRGLIDPFQTSFGTIAIIRRDDKLVHALVSRALTQKVGGTLLFTLGLIMLSLLFIELSTAISRNGTWVPSLTDTNRSKTSPTMV